MDGKIFCNYTKHTHTHSAVDSRFDFDCLLVGDRHSSHGSTLPARFSRPPGTRIRPSGGGIDRHRPEPVPEPFSGAKSYRFYATIRATSTRVSTTAPQKLAILKIFPSIVVCFSCSLFLAASSGGFEAIIWHRVPKSYCMERARERESKQNIPLMSVGVNGMGFD